MSDQNGTSKPTFDFSMTTRRWGKLMRRLTAETMEIQEQIADIEDDDESPDARRRVLDAMRRLDALEEQQERLMCEVLVDVPREWLHPDAPETLNWREPESLDWLLQTKAGELQRAMQEAQNAKN